MNVWIFANDVPIDSASLALRDRSMGVLGGAFHPTADYQAVRAQIRATSWDLPRQMPLIARTEAGDRLEPAAGVFIEDVPEIDACAVTLVGVDSAIIRHYFGD